MGVAGVAGMGLSLLPDALTSELERARVVESAVEPGFAISRVRTRKELASSAVRNWRI